MFPWLKYKQRLQNVRTELNELEEEMLTLPLGAFAKEEGRAVQTIAKGVGKIAGILVRVIDSLP